MDTQRTPRINSRAKGKVGELELAHFLIEHGFDARRGQQRMGSPESPDVLGVPGFHIECKRCEAGSLYHWLEQAVTDAGEKNTPVVMHRRNRQPWVAILRLADFLKLLAR